MTNYETLLSQIKSITNSESNKLANLCNSIALIHESLGALWTGVYFVERKAEKEFEKEPMELILGPFQGPIACTRIGYARGVCGDAWSTNKTICVGNVHSYPGHIACSSLSNSEIVIPLRNNDNEVIAVLDIDSKDLNRFKETDIQGLEGVSSYIQSFI